MTETRLRLADYDYRLPAEAIAQHPAVRRSDSRLLRWRRDGGYDHLRFRDLPSLLRPDDLLVLNDTRVFAARLFGRKAKGEARVEALLLRPLGPDTRWEAMLRPGRRLPPDTEVEWEGGVTAIVGEPLGEGRRILEFGSDCDVWALCERSGHVPLPPYIDRPDGDDDVERYQTVFGTQRGSVAAPTAGLHFDETLLREIREKGCTVATLTLHVGPGTFQPLARERLESGELHPEQIRVPASTLQLLREQKASGGRIVAVGTTVCRALESLDAEALASGTDWRNSTRLMIAPGFEFEFVDVLVTNFHLPRSSLLLLVAALAGPRWKEAYELALDSGYRFYSYGDANWIEGGTS